MPMDNSQASTVDTEIEIVETSEQEEPFVPELSSDKGTSGNEAEQLLQRLPQNIPNLQQEFATRITYDTSKELDITPYLR
jgi:hypothetical protein